MSVCVFTGLEASYKFSHLHHLKSKSGFRKAYGLVYYLQNALIRVRMLLESQRCQNSRVCPDQL
jgi:hypothetical protein